MDKKSLFGTTGIRGPADTLFTDQFSFDIGRTFAIFLSDNNLNGAVAVGMDPRESSPRIKKAFVNGLNSEKRKVYDEGITCIPSMNYILQINNSLTGSSMISGSHIKEDLNGIKFFAFGEEILKEHEHIIENIYWDLKGKVGFTGKEPETVSESKAKDEYIKRLVSLARGYPQWRTVIDTGNGSQTEIMPEVFRRTNLDVIGINTDLSQKFLAKDTEVPEDFKDLQERVVSETADFGVGFDSDGDRAVFVDENGSFIPGDYSCSLIARNSSSDVIVTPVNTSQVIDKIGKHVVRTKVGSSQVVQGMKETGSEFGFEANGGGIFLDMMSRDGGRTAIEVLNIMAKSRKKLSELISELPSYYIFKEKVAYKWELKDRIMAEAKEEFKGVKVEEIDGLKIWLDDNTWILFRSSANAPEFRVFAESKDEKKAKKLLLDGISFVKNIIQSSQ